MLLVMRYFEPACYENLNLLLPIKLT